MRVIFENRSDEVTGECRKLNYEELEDLVPLTQYTSGDKFENGMGGKYRFRGGGGVYSGFRWGNPSERRHLGYPGVDGRIILRWFFRTWDFEVCAESSWRHL
jgi:hypothetical protein